MKVRLDENSGLCQITTV